ncbi:MAG: ATP-dependent DNA helicase [Cellulosilyticaceae bacterium]
MADEKIKLAVRELVESVMRQGSIDATGLVGTNRMVLGTIAHKKVQQAMDAHYEAEVPLAYETTYEGIDFLIEGRADGIIQDLIGVTIDEIKSTTTRLDYIDEDYNPLHWAQAKCYAFIYAKQQGLPSISVRLTYYHLGTKRMKHLLQVYDFETLEKFFEDLLARYGSRVKWQREWCEKRNESLKGYTFPFEAYRPGQREMAVTIYKSILEGQKLYVNAPTGTGKTISTLFPTMKAMGEGHVEKVFYLTAKTITRTVAEEAVRLMYGGGAKVKAITLTAKDKICFLAERKCTREDCQYANGHFDRVDEAIKDALDHEDLLTREVITTYAKKYKVCPFELALDLSLHADVIICDYNYVFDPTASLKRFKDNKGFVILIDEAHNLVDRGREMFSATLSKVMVQQAKKALGKESSGIAGALQKMSKYLAEIKKGYMEMTGSYISKEAPKQLKEMVRIFIEEVDMKLQEGMGDLPSDFIDFYFEAQNFVKMYELYDERYVTYGESYGHDVRIKMFCLDPSFLISEILSTCQSAIFFSATLLPIQYYKYMLGGLDDKAIYLSSIFDKEKNLRLIARDVSTRYQHRSMSYSKIANYIQTLAEAKLGNYMVFFPSYQYMEEVYKQCEKDYPDLPIRMQSTAMDEEAREAYLNQFEKNPTQTTIGFCVLGGIFSEGIDLTGDRLIGVIVVGVGLPQIGLERDLIKYYFDEKGMEGYHYAYTYPGMNKVLQAVGRLIRTEADEGVALLIDDRYLSPTYQILLPEHLLPYEVVDQQACKGAVEQFYQHQEK